MNCVRVLIANYVRDSIYLSAPDAQVCTAKPGEYRRMKIMIVDDHTGIRAMLRSLLSNPDIQLSECTDGVQALAVYNEVRPDWVFMDSAMNELDGVSATRRIKNAFPEARILMISEDDIEQLRRAARAAGACAFVSKDHLLHELTQHRGAPLNQLEPLWNSPD